MTPADDTREYIVEADDWLGFLRPPFRGRFLDELRGLDLSRLQHLPPPKLGGLPLGREWRVLSRFMSGRCTVFEPSALSGVYRALSPRRAQDLFRAFVLGETLLPQTWADLIGATTLRGWEENHLFRADSGGQFLRFRVYGIGPLTLIADGEKPLLLRRVVAGTDSLLHVDFIDAHPQGRLKRCLDVGPGSGVVLLSAARHCEEGLGLDINPRAVEVTRLNAELNQMPHVRAEQADVFEHAGRFGRFDLVTWNMPFMLMPDRCKHTHFDAYGGHMGVEIQARFLRLLPTLLTPEGRAILLATTTILESGEDLLAGEIRTAAAETRLDFDVHVVQAFWSVAFRNYQIECGVRNFESWFLVIRPGSGRIRKIERPLATRMVDGVRGWLHGMRNPRRGAGRSVGPPSPTAQQRTEEA
ncbi:N5-glutamine S-adenosyl-L-methionine-dependent methyltransferase [Phycisphaerae bacterium RAS1]|nr:N5-glutamine S-adenosyl-L-methionine-dependent methyltransferase [Phycisphaerae bacterium RAS1]